jgi:hypothetical protein
MAALPHDFANKAYHFADFVADFANEMTYFSYFVAKTTYFAYYSSYCIFWMFCILFFCIFFEIKISILKPCSAYSSCCLDYCRGWVLLITLPDTLQYLGPVRQRQGISQQLNHKRTIDTFPLAGCAILDALPLLSDPFPTSQFPSIS